MSINKLILEESKTSNKLDVSKLSYMKKKVATPKNKTSSKGQLLNKSMIGSSQIYLSNILT